MSENENRPSLSGLDEVFGAPAENKSEKGGFDDRSQPNREKRRFDRKKGRNRRNFSRDKKQDRENGEEILTETTETAEIIAAEESFVLDTDTFSEDGGEYTEIVVETEAPSTVEVVGVRFKEGGKSYYFAPGELKIEKNSFVIVETARGPEYGKVSSANMTVPASEIVPPLRGVIRIATEEDARRNEANIKSEKEAFTTCLGKIRDHELEMKLIDAEYTFDQSKLTFYFSAEGRVDFRELVKDLAALFRTRIELRQIGIRDEAKLVGGLGVCGRPFCCTTFLSDFAQVSIKMAKEQNLSLNSAKISGACGRLMCCLRFEHEVYEEEIKKTPGVGKTVKTAEGIGTVIETSPLRGQIKVKLGDDNTFTIKQFSRDEVTVIPKSKQ